MQFVRPVSLKSALLESRTIVRKQVYIGLDFGTTFAKLSYEVAPTTDHRKKTVRFNDGYYLPTVLYFDSGTLRFTSTGGISESIVKFFKYSMVSDELEKNPHLNAFKCQLSTSPEKLCSAHYLACLLRRAIAIICESEHMMKDAVSWSVNMGMPVGRSKSSSPQVQPIYDEVLQVAWAWSGSERFDESVDVRVLDSFYVEHQLDQNDRLHTVPELYAELSMYHQDRNVPEGFYSIVDVGGGTVDMAVFFKAIDPNRGVRIYCIAHEVSSEGMESVVSRIAENANQEIRAKIRNCMLNHMVDFEKLGLLELNDPRLSERGRRLILSVKRFRESYGTCLRTAKANKESEMRDEIKNNGVLKYFVMGGGKSIHFHNQLLRMMIAAQSNAGVARAEEGDIRKYLESSANFEVNDDRLLISQMLAQPFENIPPLDGRPWEFHPSAKVDWSESPNGSVTYSEVMEDCQREIYGDY